jgi:hypothetical protein
MMKTDVPLLFGIYGGATENQAARLRDCGGNALWFHGFQEESFELCARMGLAACVEFPTFRADFSRRPDLVPVGMDGRPIRYGSLVQGVCLSHRDFLAEIEEKLRRGLQRFQPAGIWLDYLAGAGWFETPEPDLQRSCFCHDCLAEFKASTGLDETEPAEIVGSHAEAWTTHQCRRIAGFAERYSGMIRQELPGCVVGAYLCPWTPEEYGGALRSIFAQDYGLLAPWIDVFTPLLYVQKSGREPSWVREFFEDSPRFTPTTRPVQPILDALDYPACVREAAESRTPGWGFQLFAGASVFDEAGSSRDFADAVARITQRARA